MSNIPEPVFLTPHEWLEQEEPYKGRAYRCVENLSKKELAGREIRLLEVGPFPAHYNSSRAVYIPAPICEMQKRNPHFHCAAIGPQCPDECDRTKLLGSVPFIQSLYDSRFSRSDKADGKMKEGFIDFEDAINTILGGRPNIIYAQHTIERSPGYQDSIPYGPYGIFDQAAKHLVQGGFLVIDNAGGEYGQIGMIREWPHASSMALHSVYQYDDWDRVLQCKPSIFVFQKQEVKIPTDVYTQKIQNVFAQMQKGSTSM